MTLGLDAHMNNGTAVLSIGFATNNIHISYSYDHNLQAEICNILMEHMK